MYGAPICPGCVAAKAEIEGRHDVELDYRNITESTSLMKEFLAFRDHDDLFKEVIESGRIGIPFFIKEDGTKTFDLEEVLSYNNMGDTQAPDIKAVTELIPVIDGEELLQDGDACRLDGTGKC
jgi:glutaredoxin-related protein